MLQAYLMSGIFFMKIARITCNECMDIGVEPVYLEIAWKGGED